MKYSGERIYFENSLKHVISSSKHDDDVGEPKRASAMTTSVATKLS